MAQAFTTTYEKYHLWHNYSDRTKTLKPCETVYHEPPKADIWIVGALDPKQQMAAQTIDELLVFRNRLYRNRLYSTYQVSYCKDQIQEKERKHGNPGHYKSEGKAEKKDDDEENELLEYGKRLYVNKKPKIFKPMPTSRKLYGYLRPTQCYTPLTEYQFDIGQNGFKILHENHLRCKKKGMH